MKKHANISIFIPHVGCMHTCSFCNQHAITGAKAETTKQDVEKACSKALETLKAKRNYSTAEIAFFGGSFTAIPKDYMIDLLKATVPFMQTETFTGIRVSTRPDAINEEVLELLKKYNVTSIELGAQSMDDEVLKKNRRGHSSEDVEKASKLVKKTGFQLGLQMMTGLYGSDIEKDKETAGKLAKLKPDTMRVYPTMVMRDTYLEELYASRKYTPFTQEESIEICSWLINFFENENNIKIIRLGLHSDETMKENLIAGAYHPAFREICESRILREKLEKLIAPKEKNKDIMVFVSPKTMSKMIGQKKENIQYFENLGYNIKVREKKNLKNMEIIINQKWDVKN